MALFNAHGRVSWFGGPEDTGVSPSEDLAWFETWDQVVDADAEHLFLSTQPPGTTGLARRLNPETHFVACRWDYSSTPKSMLKDQRYKARVSAGGKSFLVSPIDWGPHEQETGRAADISSGLMSALGISTDDIVDVEYPYEEAVAMRIAMSSGHSTKCQGAIGYLNEVEEATRAVDRIAEIWKENGIECWTFHDTTSTDSSTNLNKITDWHNSRPSHELDVSVHLNAYQSTSKPMGCECLYVTQSSLASKVAAAMAGALQLPNRGGKFRDDLFVLNQTNAPCVLLECCFVDSTSDADAWRARFEDFCYQTASAIAGRTMQPPDTEQPPIEPPPVAVEQVVGVHISAPPGVRVDVDIVETQG